MNCSRCSFRFRTRLGSVAAVLRLPFQAVLCPATLLPPAWLLTPTLPAGSLTSWVFPAPGVTWDSLTWAACLADPPVSTRTISTWTLTASPPVLQLCAWKPKSTAQPFLGPHDGMIRDCADDAVASVKSEAATPTEMLHLDPSVMEICRDGSLCLWVSSYRVTWWVEMKIVRISDKHMHLFAQIQKILFGTVWILLCYLNLKVFMFFLSAEYFCFCFDSKFSWFTVPSISQWSSSLTQEKSELFYGKKNNNNNNTATLMKQTHKT